MNLNQSVIRPLSVEEGKSMGFDTSDWITDVDAFIFSYGECDIYFEKSIKCVWVLHVQTHKDHRNRGFARRAIHDFIKYVESENLRIIVGEFTEDGENYIKKYFQNINEPFTNRSKLINSNLS
jgi:GNAT superfamily N-acetyltransferase